MGTLSPSNTLVGGEAVFADSVFLGMIQPSLRQRLICLHILWFNTKEE